MHYLPIARLQGEVHDASFLVGMITGCGVAELSRHVAEIKLNSLCCSAAA
jgi:hypothetical protein